MNYNVELRLNDVLFVREPEERQENPVKPVLKDQP